MIIFLLRIIPGRYDWLTDLLGGFFNINVFNLWLNSRGPWWPHALQLWDMLPFFEEIKRVVSGLSQPGHKTNFRMNPSKRSCNFAASWLPLTMNRSFLKSNWVWAPNSQPKYFVGSKKLYYKIKNKFKVIQFIKCVCVCVRIYMSEVFPKLWQLPSC